MFSRVVLLCFFLSGLTGLVYQVIWLRMLSLVFGHTVYAITTVLAAFMGGLALGSFVFGRLAFRVSRPVRLYGLMEIAIGLSCAAIPLALGLVSSAYIAVHRTYAFSYDTFNVVQFVLVVVLLLIPTALMGGTLPILSQAFVNQPVELGRKVGALYTVNTLGAVIGVALAGYLLLPTVGIRWTVGSAAAANVAVGILALAVGRRWVPARDPVLEIEAHDTAVDRPRAHLVIVGALGVSGAVSMVYEVAWTRALSLVIGSSTYAFSGMLLAFLIGIAGGSALYTWVATRFSATTTTFALLQVGIGVTAAVTLLLFEELPFVFLAALRWSRSPAFVQTLQVATSTAVLLASTLCIGATLPCAIAIVGRVSRVGRDVGHVYASNTAGAILGVIAGGFLLLPRVGLHTTLQVAIATNLVLAALVLLGRGRPTRARAIGIAAAGLAAGAVIALIPPWDRALMTSGPAIYSQRYLDGDIAERLRRRRENVKLLYYRDGASGTIAVYRSGQHRYLTTNGKTDAGTGDDMATQLLSGHLPMLMHPAPSTAVVIGLGSGVTAGAVADHPVTRVDVVEIEPAVIGAARWFAEENHHVLDNPRVRVIVADGRHFLLTSPLRYDVIISEPSNPWISGLASLFSVEFFKMARERLQPNGIMVQWVQGYHLSSEDLRMVVNTFQSVFPSTSIWSPGVSDYLLVGRVEPAPIDLRLLKTRYETNIRVWGAFTRLDLLSWASLLGDFILDEGAAARMAAGAGLNTDDRLPLEFSAPRALYDAEAGARNQTMLRAHRTAALPAIAPDSLGELEDAEVRFRIGLEYQRRGIPEAALEQLEHALRIDPTHVPALLAASEVETRLGRADAALARAIHAIAREPAKAEAHYRASLAAEASGRRAEARAFIERAVTLDPSKVPFQEALRRLSGP